MFKLYVPSLLINSKDDRQPGPLVSVLAPAVAQARLTSLGRPFAEEINPDAPVPEVVLTGNSTEALGPQRSIAKPVIEAGELFPRLDPNMAQRRICIRSFSSLHRQYRAPGREGPHYGDRPARDDEDAAEDGDALRGPIFGEMLHEVLETIDFNQIGQASSPQELPMAAAALIEDVRLGHWPRLPDSIAGDPDMEKGCRREMARLVWSALHTPLAAAAGPLWKVPNADRRSEMEFYFPEWDGSLPPGTHWQEGFLTGIIDLVFRRAGKLFLLDWKTNLLPSYTPQALAQVMREADYVRQYRLYLQALARWLRRLRGDRFDFLQEFGGVYYLFLRGLNGRDEGSGVFFHQPTAEDLSLPHVLRR